MASFMQKCSWASLAAACVLAPSALAAAEPVDYVRDVKPILAKNCYACHGPQKQKSGLRLDTAAALLKGGNSGPGLVPGKGGDSTVIKAVTGADGFKRMPPEGGPLGAGQVAVLKAWIDQGAKVPAEETAENATPTKGGHWAFRPPVRPPAPAVKDASWPRNAIDRFLLVRLEKEGLRPSPEADRVTLIRRVSLDLTGLPPTLEEVDAFLADARPDAYERLVDRLLASPHYGERWGRHWLDLARYADSNGFNIDAPRSIWKYRDWVIDALNRDLPFDQFTVEQIAGDLLPNATVEQKIATGFHRNTLINQEGGIDVEQFRVESIVDRVNTTGTVFLGLTVGCAQCHDHKFDPVSQREFYQLFTFLNNCDEPNLEVPLPGQLEQRARVRAEIAKLQKQLKAVDATSDASLVAWEKNLRPQDKAGLPAGIQKVLDLPDNGRTAKQQQQLLAFYRQVDQVRYLAAGVGDQRGILAAAGLHAVLLRSSLEKQIADRKKREPEVVTTMVLQERKAPRETYVHLGGDFLRKGVRVYPGVPAALHPLQAHESQPVGSAAPNRLDLARWLVDAKNPLTARVTVNRLWQQYFGLGLVETENDFGTQGTPPSHPELLDWLATEFLERKWSLKEMHRLIVTSAAYRQSSKQRPELAAVDPRNRLLARQSRLRLEAEVVRDVSLAASGLLSRKVGGPGVFPPQPEGVYRFTQIPRDWKASTGPDRYRRGMYTYFWRSAPHPGLTVFDAPDSTTACTRRNRSNTPLQALTLLNDQAAFEFARALATRVLTADKMADDAERIRFAFRQCLSREPSTFEHERLGKLLARQRAAFEADPKGAKELASAGTPKGAGEVRYAAWVSVARVLLNLDEFLTRE